MVAGADLVRVMDGKAIVFGLRPNVGGHVLPHDLTDVIAAHEANGAALMVGSNCTRPRNTAGHRIASLPTSHLLLCMDSQTRHPEQRFTPPIFFLTGVYLPRPARRLSAPRQPTLRRAFCFDNSRTRSGPTRRPGAASDGGRRPYRGTPIKGRRWNPPELARQGDTHTAGGMGRGDQPR
jgi:hypothetical protein